MKFFFYVGSQEYLCNNYIQSDRQFGFRQNHSTESALHSILTKIYWAERDEYCLAVFLDAYKAFDSIDRNILMQKLEHYGFKCSVLSWYMSFLSHRRQFVLLDGRKSSTQDIPVGSPQGSSISALLFILFINDLANVSNNTECPMFADDTSIFCFGSNLNQFYTTMNKQLKIHCKWFNANKLSIFANKTNYIIFHKSRQNVYNDN